MINFGIPKKREVKVEKYPNTPVLTIHPKPETKGKSHKFSLNQKAIEVLGVNLEDDNKVSFSFQEDKVYFAVTNGIDCESYNLYKNGSFSDKKLHEYLTENYDLEAGDYELIMANNENGIQLFEFVAISNEEHNTVDFGQPDEVEHNMEAAEVDSWI